MSLENIKNKYFSIPSHIRMIIWFVLIVLFFRYLFFILAAVLIIKLLMSERTSFIKLTAVILLLVVFLPISLLWFNAFKKGWTNDLSVNFREVSRLVNNSLSEFREDSSVGSVGDVEEYLVTRVIDGDTIEIEGGQKVRYIGIDTPETVSPNDPVGCFGLEASRKNKELVEGKKVRMEKDISETDRFGRLLRYVWVEDRFINDYLVKEGFAHAVAFPPDIKYQEQFRKSEADARENGRGLWSFCSSPQK